MKAVGKVSFITVALVVIVTIMNTSQIVELTRGYMQPACSAETGASSSSSIDRNSSDGAASQNLAIAYISINGLPRKKWNAPQFPWALHTLATQGQFRGHVMIITNQPKLVESLVSEVQQAHREETQSITYHVVAVEKPEPTILLEGPNAGSAKMTISAKMYKTKLFEMLPEGVNVERILYLDRDMLPLRPIQTTLDIALQDAKRQSGDDNPALMMMAEPGGPGTILDRSGPTKGSWHSGLMLVTREASGCMREWASVLAAGQFDSDQHAFMACPTCLGIVHRVPQVIYFPDKIKPKLPEVVVSMVHYTGYRAHSFMNEKYHPSHRAFLEENFDGIPEQYLNLTLLKA